MVTVEFLISSGVGRKIKVALGDLIWEEGTLRVGPPLVLPLAETVRLTGA